MIAVTDGVITTSRELFAELVSMASYAPNRNNREQAALVLAAAFLDAMDDDHGDGWVHRAIRTHAMGGDVS